MPLDPHKYNLFSGLAGVQARQVAALISPAQCVLYETSNSGEARVHQLGARGATFAANGGLTPIQGEPDDEHDRIAHEGGSWKLTTVSRAELCLNGVRRPGGVDLVAGDQITTVGSRFMFFPLIEPVKPQAANGFDRARHHIHLALEQPGEIDRDMVKALADLEGEIDTAERMAVVLPAIPLMNKQSWDAALAVLDKAAAANPNHANLQLHRAICLAMLDRIEDALTAASRAKQFAEDNETRAELKEWLDDFPTLVVQSAIRKLNADKYNLAKAILKAAQVHYPQHFGVLFHLAICHAKDGEFTTASDVLERAARCAEDDDDRAEVKSMQDQIGAAGRRATVEAAVKKAMEQLGDSRLPGQAAAALDTLGKLPPDALDRDDVKLIYLLARAKAIASGTPRTHFRDSRAVGAWNPTRDTMEQVTRELRELIAETDDPEIRSTANSLLRQLQ